MISDGARQKIDSDIRAAKEGWLRSIHAAIDSSNYPPAEKEYCREWVNAFHTRK